MRGLKEAGWERWGWGCGWGGRSKGGQAHRSPCSSAAVQRRSSPANTAQLFSHTTASDWRTVRSKTYCRPSYPPPPAPPPREHHCWSSLLELAAAAHWTRGSPQSESDGRKRRQEAVTRGNYFISCSFPLLQVSTKKECTILTTGGRGEGEGVSKGLLSPSLPPARFSINSAGIKGGVCCEEKGKTTTHKQQQRGRSHVSRVGWAKSWRWT